MANQYTKAKEQERKEIIWNLINAGLAGALVFLGSLANGDLTWRGVIAAAVASFVVAVTKFKDYWASEEKDYTSKIFSFVR